MVLEGFVQALQYFIHAEFWFWITGGIIVGLIFGITPGVGSLLATALFLPFCFFLKPEQALPFIIALRSVVFTSGAITPILLGIPGHGPSVVTILDGFPMTEKGEGSRALGAAIVGSGMGNIYSAAFALATMPLILPLVFTMTSGDMVFIILLAISCITVLSRGNLAKGWISGGLGLLISLIGFQNLTGTFRFTFGTLYLRDGIPLISVFVGLMGLPIMIDLARTSSTLAKPGAVIKGLASVLEGAKDVFRHWGLTLRSSIIGYIIGVIPGIGADSSVWIAYAQAKQTSKHPDKFGTGIVEGVIAPETANNANEAGGLQVTLALGVPGGAGMAIFLAALILVGITPGPPMMREQLGLALSLIIVTAVAGIISAIACLFIATPLAQIANIPSRTLVPLVIVLIFVGAFAFHEELLDLGIVLIFTVLGLLMKQFDYNRPALLIGYIMGGLFEYYLFIALKTSGSFFFVRPISIGLILAIIALLTFSPIKRLIVRRIRMRKAA